jgi:hypothetical protein
LRRRRPEALLFWARPAERLSGFGPFPLRHGRCRVVGAPVPTEDRSRIGPFPLRARRWAGQSPRSRARPQFLVCPSSVVVPRRPSSSSVVHSCPLFSILAHSCPLSSAGRLCGVRRVHGQDRQHAARRPRRRLEAVRSEGRLRRRRTRRGARRNLQPTGCDWAAAQTTRST